METAHQSGLGQLLEQFEHSLDAVDGALRAEAAAVSSSDPSALFGAVERKRDALKTLEGIARDERLVTLLQSRAQPPRLQDMITKLADCRARNQAAGAAISGARRTNDQLLRLLGQAPEPAAYAPDGQTANAARHRDLGSA